MKFTGIVPGGKREMLSIPFQMTARYVKEHPDDITEEESEVIDKMLYMETLAERYDPVSADPVKGFAFYEIHNTSDYLDYIRVWFTQGCRHPGSYVNAFFAMESGWFSWTKYYPLLNMDWHSQLNTTVFSEASTVRPPVIKGLAEDFQKMLDDLYENPLIRLIFTYAFYAALQTKNRLTPENAPRSPGSRRSPCSFRSPLAAGWPPFPFILKEEDICFR